MSDLNYAIGNYGQATAIAVYPTIIQSATITTSGGPVQITVTGDGEPNGDGWHRLQIFRNSTAISEILHVEAAGSGFNVTVSMSHIDTPVTGTYTYSVRVVNGSGISIRYTETGQLSMIVEEKMGGNAISNNWLRREIGSPDTYYGYSFDYNATNSDAKWSIKKVTVSGSVETVTWSNGSPGSNISIWDDRASYFTAPSGSLGLTASLVTFTQQAIQISWSLITGVDIYSINIKDASGNSYTSGGHILYNLRYNSQYTDQIYNSNKYIYNFPIIGMTYSITIVAANVSGSITEDTTIKI